MPFEPSAAPSRGQASGVWPVPARMQPYVAWFTPPRDEGELAGLDVRRRSAVLLVACHASAMLLLVSLGLRLALARIPPWPWWSAAAVMLAGLLAGPLVLRGTRSVERASVVAIGSVALALPVMGLEGGGVDAPVMAMVPTIPLVSAFLVGLRGAALISVVLAVEVILVASLANAGWLPESSPPSEMVKAMLLVGFLGLTTFVARIYHLERKAIEARLQSLAKELYESSIRDPLTGAFNRRHFSERIAHELAFARRHGQSVGIILIDVDHFKRVNDEHGHLAGDRVLVTLVTEVGLMGAADRRLYQAKRAGRNRVVAA